jgi:hypothetical protein
MSYDEPPKCICGHRGEFHREWYGPRPKDCVTHRNGVRCDCKTYVRSTT